MANSELDLRIEKRLGVILKVFKELKKMVRFRCKEGHSKPIFYYEAKAA